MKPQEFTDDEWQKEDNELFTDLTEILDASKPTPEFNTISCKTYPYSDESRDSSPVWNIPDLVENEKYDEENDTISENEESHLQLNRGIETPIFNF